MKLRIVLFSIAALLLGAHFYRAGDYYVVALCLSVPLLFLVRVRWSLYLLQGLAYGAAACWVDTAMGIVELRRQFGQPWLSAAAIMLAVTLFTMVTGLLLNSRAIRQHYP